MNEVELTSTTFPNAIGVYEDFMESVNAAITDILQEEDNCWPFQWQTTTFQTVIGQQTYTPAAGIAVYDWDSFRIKRNPISISGITQTGGTATATAPSGHQLQTGDTTYIQGANQSGYVGNFTVIVTSPTQFTFSVPSSTVSPATGTLTLIPVYNTSRLTPIDRTAYQEEGHEAADDNQVIVGDFGLPDKVVRNNDNTFLISCKPDRIYTVAYDYFANPNELVNYNDVPLIPVAWKEVIVKGAIYYAYMFRDNAEEAAGALALFKDAVNSMRRSLIPQEYFMRIDRSLMF